MLGALGAPIVAVSPIVGGRAIKGPAAKMFAEQGIVASSTAVARHYGKLLSGLIIDTADAADCAALSKEIRTHVCKIVMTTLDDKIGLAREVVSVLKDIATDSAGFES